MQACKATIQSILEDALVLAASHGLDAPLRGRAPEVRQALDAYRPSLMVFGLFNAGKSTLINALLGVPEARVSDAPCTDRVVSYRFGEYELLDTPGLDAPPSHEQVSEAQVARTHVVAFVIGTDGSFDEVQTVRRLAQLVVERKPVVVVLNDKNAHGPEAPEAQALCQLVRSHLLRETGSPDLVAAVPILTVNAEGGLRGRAEGKARLLEVSGVPQLEQLLLDMLMRTSGDRLVLPALDLLDGELRTLRAELFRAVGTGEAQALEALRQRVVRARQGFTERVTTVMKEQRAGLVRELEMAMQAGQPLQPAAERFVGRLAEAAEAEAVTLLESDLGDVIRAAGQATLQAPAVAVTGQAAGPRGAAGLDAALQLAPVVVEKVLKPEQLQPVFRAGLEVARSLKVPGVAGRWGTTLDRWAGNMSRGVGFVVQAGLAAFQIAQAYQAQQAAEQAAVDERCRLREAAVAAADDLRRGLERQLPDLGRQVFGGLEAELAQQAAATSAAVAAREAALAAVDAWREQLADLRASVVAALPDVT
jgi:hypothetical protein